MKRMLQATKNLIQILLDIFDDWLTRGAGIVVVLIIAIVIYNMGSNLTETHPLLGALVYAMVPALFIAGGVIFVMAILKFSKPEPAETPGATDKKRQKQTSPVPVSQVNNENSLLVEKVVSENE